MISDNLTCKEPTCNRQQKEDYGFSFPYPCTMLYVVVVLFILARFQFERYTLASFYYQRTYMCLGRLHTCISLVFTCTACTCTCACIFYRRNCAIFELRYILGLGLVSIAECFFYSFGWCLAKRALFLFFGHCIVLPRACGQEVALWAALVQGVAAGGSFVDFITESGRCGVCKHGIWMLTFPISWGQ
jgi:hypothetical protein